MILPEISRNIEYIYNSNDYTETYYYGDFLRKTSEFLKDSPDKWNLVCKITDIQSAEHINNNIYNNTLRKFDSELSNYISTHEDPFIL